MIAVAYDCLPCLKIFIECGGFNWHLKNSRAYTVKKLAKFVNAKACL